MASTIVGLSRRERKKRETRERLLLAAWEHFNEKGFDATTVEEITESADVAKGTFFNYFDSKEEALRALITWGMDRLQERIDPTLGAPSSPVARLELLLESMLKHFSANGSLFRKTFMIYLRRADRENPEHSLLHMAKGLVQEAQNQGAIRDDVDTAFVTRLLLCGCWPDPHEEPASVNVRERMDLILGGLAGPKWRST